MKKHERWNNEKTREVLVEFAKGKTYHEVAAHFGIHHTTLCTNIKRRLGLQTSEIARVLLTTSIDDIMRQHYVAPHKPKGSPERAAKARKIKAEKREAERRELDSLRERVETLEACFRNLNSLLLSRYSEERYHGPVTCNTLASHA